MLPVLFSLPTPWGPQPVYAYGVLLGLSFIVGFQLVERVGNARDGIARATLGNAYLAASLCGVVGARLLYVLENQEQFTESDAGWLDVTSGGLAAYGGLVGALLGAGLYLRWKQTSLAAFGDAAAPAIGIGTALTRVGCYLYGCDFGTLLGAGAPAWLQALGRFPRWRGEHGLIGSPPFLHHAQFQGLPPDAAASLPVHPVQLYEALGGLLLLGLSIYVWQRRRYQGQVILAVGGGYALLRFALEYLRDDPERAFWGGFSSAQWFSLLLGAACVVLASVMRGRARRA